MSDLRELNIDDLDAVIGGCRTLDRDWYIDAIVAQSAGSFADNSTAKSGPHVLTKLTLIG